MTDETMPVRVTCRTAEVPESLREHARGRAARLVRRHAGVRGVEVVLSLDGKKKAVAECVVHLRRGAPLTARGEAADGWAAVDRAFDRSSDQLGRARDRRRTVRRRRKTE